MARRQEKRLDPLTIKALNTPGRHADGGNLYLVVDKPDGDKHGAKRWVFLFRWEGKLREMGLGGFPAVSLAKARDKARAAQELRSDDKNPIEVRAAQAKADRVKPTFGEAAEAFVESMKPQWRNEKHQAQWSTTLKTYAAPLWSIRVDEVDTPAVVSALKSIWTDKPETAARLRGRIERVLDAARAQGHRTGENPARWRGHLDHLLPQRQKLTRGHHAAMPYNEVPAFVKSLRQREAVSAHALEFLILTAARSGEVLGARWSEIDLKGKIWTIPGNRMKAGREHRVPLSDRTIEILKSVAPLALNTSGSTEPQRHLFPGSKRDAPLSVMAFEMLLRRMKVDVTTHGFRSSFRDWSGEVSSFPREIAEAALAHTIGDQTERAYRRGDALEKRRKMMEAWAEYVNITPLTPPPPKKRRSPTMLVSV